MRIFTHLRGHAPAAVATAALAAVSLACLLAAPLAAAATLACGLVQGGMEDCVPARIHVETLANVEKGLDPEALTLVEASFTAANRSGVRTYAGDPADRAELSRALEAAEAEAWRAAASGRSRVPDAQAARSFVADAYRDLGLDTGQVERAYVARGMHAAMALAVVAGLAALAATSLAWFVARGEDSADPEVGEGPLSGRALVLAPAGVALASVVASGVGYLALAGAPSAAVDLVAAAVMVLCPATELGLVALLARRAWCGGGTAETPATDPDPDPDQAEVLVFPAPAATPEDHDQS